MHGLEKAVSEFMKIPESEFIKNLVLELRKQIPPLAASIIYSVLMKAVLKKIGRVL